MTFGRDRISGSGSQTGKDLTMTRISDRDERTFDQIGIARLMIATIAFTALVMAFGLTLIAAGNGAIA